jgi:hypothetical protein
MYKLSSRAPSFWELLLVIIIGVIPPSVYLLYKNPILFVLPSIGSIISIIFEAFYLVGLRNNNNNNNNNNQNYFPFSDIFIDIKFQLSCSSLQI